MATFEIFQDQENVVPKNTRKSKRLEADNLKDANKANKRAALGNITNIVGSRVQPSRAAKVKEKVYKHSKSDPIVSPIPVPAAFGTCKNGPPSALSNKYAGSPMALTSPINDSVCSMASESQKHPHIRDIDAKTDITFEIREYAHDIHSYLKKQELRNRAKPNYMKKQTDINQNMRTILVDWLVEVAEEYKLLPQTLHLTVNYIDRFLSCMSVIRGKLQLVGTACMLVASKFEEIYPPEVSEFVYITDDTYTSKQVLRMEHLILKALNFDLSVPTSLNFLQRYLLAAGAEKDGQLEHLCRYLCELALVEVDPFINYLPSTIAAASLFVANYTLGKEHWTPTIEHYSGYQLENLDACIRDIHKMFDSAPNWNQTAIQTKYKSAKFSSVSTLSPPDCLPLF